MDCLTKDPQLRAWIEKTYPETEKHWMSSNKKVAVAAVSNKDNADSFWDLSGTLPSLLGL